MERYKIIPPNKPPSKSPRKNLHARRPLRFISEFYVAGHGLQSTPIALSEAST